MIGFLAGILFANIFGKAYILGVGLLGEYFLLHFRYTQINYSKLFTYVLEERLKWFFIIGILGITNIGIPVIMALFVWLGFSGGVFLSVAIMKFGIKGIAVSLGAILPQFLIYIPVIIIYADKLVNRKMTDNKLWKKQNWLQYVLFLLIGILSIGFGSALEGYINPLLLKWVLSLLNLNG